MIERENLIASAYNNGVYVIALDNGVAVSNNGTHWKNVQFFSKDSISKIYGVASGRNMFVAVGSYGKIYHSAGGWSSWYESNLEKQKEEHFMFMLKGVAYGNGRFITGGDRGNLFESRDGKNWSRIVRETVKVPSPHFEQSDFPSFFLRHKPDIGNIEGVVFGKENFICVGNKGIFASQDGREWEKVHHVHGQNFDRIFYSDEKFIALGKNAVGKKIVYQSESGRDFSRIDVTLKSHTTSLEKAKGGR